MIRKPLPIVEVEWIDSAHHSGWTSRDEWEDSLQSKTYERCRTAGYLLKKSKDAVVIVQSQGGIQAGSDCVDAVMIIPRVAVTAMRTMIIETDRGPV